MTNEIDTMTTQNDNVTSGLGALFRTAREQLNLTQKDAALRLRLGVNIVYLIENDDFTGGPPITFMRGYIRSYAKLLNIAETALTSTLNQLDPQSSFATSSAVTLLNTRAVKQHDRKLRFMNYSIVLTLIALVCIWWATHSRYTSDLPEKATATVALDTRAKVNPVNSPIPELANKEAVANPNQMQQAIKLPDATTQTALPLTAQAPAIAATAPSTAVAPPKEPAHKMTSAHNTMQSQGISKMVMALPEPGLDNDETPGES